MATKAEQQHRVLKAKVAMALYSEYGRVPKEKEIDEVYHLTRILYKAVLGTHFLRKQQARTVTGKFWQGAIDLWRYRKRSRELTQQFVNELAALLNTTTG